MASDSVEELSIDNQKNKHQLLAKEEEEEKFHTNLEASRTLAFVQTRDDMVLKRNPKYEIYWSKDNEWAIIDEEEEEEKAKRMKEGPPPDVASFVAGLLVVLVPATCGFLWWRR